MSMRLTVSIEQDVIERAVSFLRAGGKSLDDEINEHLTHIANGDQEAIRRRLEAIDQLRHGNAND